MLLLRNEWNCISTRSDEPPSVASPSSSRSASSGPHSVSSSPSLMTRRSTSQSIAATSVGQWVGDPTATSPVLLMGNG